MSKRRVDEYLSDDLPSKRRRTVAAGRQTDHLSALSNEIVLHILSFLPIPALLTCQRLSHRFYALAGDSELWKRQYYSKWVRPRARRLAVNRRFFLPQSKFEYSPRVSTWLDHGHLDRNYRVTHWKRQYQLRHNWSRGTCRVTQVELPQPPKPPMLVTLCAGYVFTADSHGGLRVWSVESPNARIAALSFANSELQALSAPTALTATCGLEKNSIEVVIGFDDGVFSVYRMDMKSLRLEKRFSRSRSAQGAVTAMAASYPYLLVVSKHMVLSLYKLPLKGDDPSWGDMANLIASLKADSILSPMSLSVRLTGSEIIASIVYSFLHLGCGWSIGIQELHFDTTGQQSKSRLATTVDIQYGVRPHRLPRLNNEQASAPGVDEPPVSPSASPRVPAILHRDPPTSVSYSHPYLLTSHADNTLTVYLVVSTSSNLFVKGGQRLFGHTSSVSAVQVSDRGKAVSASLHGDEIRIWELESLISSFGSQKLFQGDNSIQVKPENKWQPPNHEAAGLSGMPRLGFERTKSESTNLPHKLARAQGCIGFDDERLLLFREKEHGSQLLEFYDFR
ncbi:WD domain protein [Aspergillus undulatus]|uniref:WD domain protein n=1 Tax=Aspergillus undulatus TaxID=1810928 RepID=UPI003CCE1372